MHDLGDAVRREHHELGPVRERQLRRARADERPATVRSPSLRKFSRSGLDRPVSVNVNGRGTMTWSRTAAASAEMRASSASTSASSRPVDSSVSSSVVPLHRLGVVEQHRAGALGRRPGSGRCARARSREVGAGAVGERDDLRAVVADDHRVGGAPAAPTAAPARSRAGRSTNVASAGRRRRASGTAPSGGGRTALRRRSSPSSRRVVTSPATSCTAASVALRPSRSSVAGSSSADAGVDDHGRERRRRRRGRRRWSAWCRGTRRCCRRGRRRPRA